MAIADAILNQIQQAGQPRTITSTETVTGRESVDASGLGLLLYMLMEGMGGGPSEPPLGGEVEAGFLGPDLSAPTLSRPPALPIAPPEPSIPNAVRNPSLNFGTPFTPQLNFGQMDPMQVIMRIIGSLGAGRGGGF